MSAALSYSSGESATPLLGDTIGGSFDATAVRFSGREALVDRTTGRRWTYAELAADVDALAGYVVSARHGRLSFAVLVNDRRADDRAVDAGIDAMLDILARS